MIAVNDGVCRMPVCRMKIAADRLLFVDPVVVDEQLAESAELNRSGVPPGGLLIIRS